MAKIRSPKQKINILKAQRARKKQLIAIERERKKKKNEESVNTEGKVSISSNTEMEGVILKELSDWTVGKSFIQKLTTAEEKKASQLQWRLAEKAIKKSRELDNQLQNQTKSLKRKKLEEEAKSEEEKSLVYRPSKLLNKERD